MLLVIKLTFDFLEDYRDSFIRCLNHNNNNINIEKIFIFLDNIDSTLPNFSKVKYIVKQKYSKSEISEYAKVISSNKFIIFSEPLVKFGDLSYIKQKNIRLTYNKDHVIYQRTENPYFVENIKKILPNKKLIQKSENKNVYRTPSNKVDVIIVSVNYNDYLSVTLEENTKIFNNITVVTSEDDIECQEICNSHNVNYIISKRIYENGGSFNKGKAINDGIKSLIDPDWILILDADIIVSNRLKIKSLDINKLYTSNRIILKTYEEYKKFKNNIEVDYNIEPDRGLGFFHLFNTFSKRKYKEFSNNASWDDIMFRDLFKDRESINNQIIHIGESYKNWDGRITDNFIYKYKSDKRILSSGDIQNSLGGIYNPGSILIDKKIYLLARVEPDYGAYSGEVIKYFTTSQHPTMFVYDEIYEKYIDFFELEKEGYPGISRIEDFRIFKYKGEIYSNHTIVIPFEDSIETKSTISKIDIYNKKIIFDNIPNILEKKRYEKNWVYFSDNDDLYMIYNISPWIIFKKSIDNDWVKIIDVNLNLKWFNDKYLSNSINPIDFFDYYLHIFHTKDDNYIYSQGFILISKKTLLPEYYTDNYVFIGGHCKGKNNGVFYIMSCVEDRNGDLLIVYGEGDSNTRVIKYDKHVLYDFIKNKSIKI
jgi:hypothetical protein